MCAVVKVIDRYQVNSDNPQDKWNVPFDAPLFHWQKGQTASVGKIYGRSISCLKEEVWNAMQAADQAQKSFDQQLKKRGEEILNEVKKKK